MSTIGQHDAELPDGVMRGQPWRVHGMTWTVGVDSRAPEDLVSSWVTAFNQRDLEGMLRSLHSDVDFRPLKLSGLERAYQGHDGVRRWFEQSQELGHDYRLDVDHVSSKAEESVYTIAGTLRLGRTTLSPFTAIHTVAEGHIRSAHHYLSEPDLITRLGLVP